MEWVGRILHSANLAYMKYGDATTYYHKLTLPFSLMKHEVLMCQNYLFLDCPIEDLGGYLPISMAEWQGAIVLKNQPWWRLNWFRKCPNMRTYYASADQELKIDPTFFTIILDHLANIQKTMPTWVNYWVQLAARLKGKDNQQKYICFWRSRKYSNSS